jgi:hypothetical protein
VANGFQQLYGWATRLGEEVMESSPFQDQVVGEETTEEIFWSSCEVESNHMGRRRGDEKFFGMDRKEVSVVV